MMSTALIGNDKLDIQATAYYVKYLQDRYVSRAPKSLTTHYSNAKITYGIYQGGEKYYVQNVLPTSHFGENTSNYLPSFSAYYAWSTRLLCGPIVSRC
jgi:hypothetical protein